MKLTYFTFVFAFVLFLSCTKTNLESDKQSPSSPAHTNCDTSAFVPTLSYNVWPIIHNNCTYACHNTTDRFGGFDLSTYNDGLGSFGLHSAAACGALVCSITHDAACGYAAMPRDLPMLDSCSIRIIAKWVKLGALNN